MNQGHRKSPLTRAQLLEIWKDRIWAATKTGRLGKDIQIAKVTGISGPRVGALHILMKNLTADVLVASLARQNSALLRNLVPWRFVGVPVAFMYDRFIRVEAGWDKDHAFTDLPLSNCGRVNPKRGLGMWAIGADEHGSTILGGVGKDHVAHWLACGLTGMGKTVILQACACQLAPDVSTKIIFVDGKRGRSFRYPDICGQDAKQLFRLNSQIGPVARTPDEWQNALVWALKEMNRRYDTGDEPYRLIVFMDEVQEIIKHDIAREAYGRLAVMGRDASVHLICATMHPVVKDLGGSTIARTFAGRISLRVTDATAAGVALGDPPLPAHRLQDKGDAYVRTTQPFRIQAAYPERAHYAAASAGFAGFDVEAWPESSAEDLGIAPRRKGRRSPWPSEVEIGAAMITSATDKAGRGFYQDLVEASTHRRPGGPRAGRTLDLARSTTDWMKAQGWQLHNGAEQEQTPAPEPEPASHPQGQWGTVAYYEDDEGAPQAPQGQWETVTYYEDDEGGPVLLPSCLPA